MVGKRGIFGRRKMEWVIMLDEGWAAHDVFEGWIGTFIESNAYKFQSRELATKIMWEKYSFSDYRRNEQSIVVQKGTPHFNNERE